MSVPQVTPTIAPTRTANQTAIASPSQSATMTISFATETQSLEPSPTALNPTPTFTLFPSDTPIPTDTLPPSPSPLPIIPTATPTETATTAPPTETELPPSETATLTLTATETPFIPPTANLTLTVMAQELVATLTAAESERENTRVVATNTALAQEFAATLSAVAMIRTQTQAALPTATATLPAPTIESIPTFITAAANTSAPQIDPNLTFEAVIGEGTATGFDATPTFTQELAPTNIPPPTPFFDPVFIGEPIIGFDPTTRSFALSTSNGLRGDVISLPGGAFTFAQNPVNPNQYARAASNGSLFVVDDINNGGVRMDVSPFSQFEPQSAELNNARVTVVKWSPDGRYLAFMVDTESDDSTDNDSVNDGIWFFEPNAFPPVQLIHDCPPQPGCDLVERSAGPYQFRSLDFEWNASSTAILIRLELPDLAANGFTVVPAIPDPSQASRLPPIYRYEFVSWGINGARVLVSGAGEDNINGIRWIDPLTGSRTLIFDASSVGLWVGHAVERPNGQILALGSPNGAGGAYRIYTANGTPITDFIGSTAPARVSWSPDRSAVLLVINENGLVRHYVAHVNGRIDEITGQVAGALAVEWISQSPVIPSSIPEVIAPVDAAQTNTPIPPDTGFLAGEQVRILAPSGVYLRSDPSNTSEQNIMLLIPPDARVTIVGSSAFAGGMMWWQIGYEGQLGWVAEQVGDQILIGR